MGMGRTIMIKQDILIELLTLLSFPWDHCLNGASRLPGFVIDGVDLPCLISPMFR